MSDNKLKKWAPEMDICIRCGYCLEQCPVFDATGWETDSPRGKVIIAHALLNGQIEPSSEIAKKFYQCVSCKDCMARCSANVPVYEIINSARSFLVKLGLIDQTHKSVIDKVIESGNIFGQELEPDKQDGDFTLYIGCQYLSRMNLVKKYIKVLERIGLKPRIKEEICCGYPIKSLGFDDEIENYHNRFQEIFPEKDIVTLCPTCAVFLKEEYGKNVKHITQVLAENLPECESDISVTYHDPCDLSRGLGIIDEPRQILEKLGVELIEMPRNRESSYCCGGGGGLLMSDVGLSDKIARERMLEAASTGADYLVTPCPTCEKVLKTSYMSLKSDGIKTIPVRNLIQIIEKVLKNYY